MQVFMCKHCSLTPTHRQTTIVFGLLPNDTAAFPPSLTFAMKGMPASKNVAF